MNKFTPALTLLFLIVFFLSSIGQSQDPDLIHGYFPDTNWRVSTPEEQGMDSQYLLRMFKAFGNQGRIIIIRNGYLVTDYNQSYLRGDNHHIHSCTKSVVSALVGKAIDEGYIKNVDQNVLEFFTDDLNIEDLSRRKKKLKLYHLLTMSSGMQWSDSNSPTDSAQMSSGSRDWAQYILDKPILEEPGKVWNYNSGGSHLLSIILQKSTGKTAEDYAEKKLFQPMGIHPEGWWKDPQGYSTAGWGLHLNSLDLSKLGFLFLRQGRWKDSQLIPAQWIKDSTRNLYSVNSGFGRGFGYGFQWWVYTDLPFYAYKAMGGYGDHSVHLIIIPDRDLVIVLAGNNSGDKSLLKSFIIPSVKSENPLPAKPAFVRELKKAIDRSVL